MGDGRGKDGVWGDGIHRAFWPCYDPESGPGTCGDLPTELTPLLGPPEVRNQEGACSLLFLKSLMTLSLELGGTSGFRALL